MMQATKKLSFNIKDTKPKIMRSRQNSEEFEESNPKKSNNYKKDKESREFSKNYSKAEKTSESTKNSNTLKIPKTVANFKETLRDIKEKFEDNPTSNQKVIKKKIYLDKKFPAPKIKFKSLSSLQKDSNNHEDEHLEPTTANTIDPSLKKSNFGNQRKINFYKNEEKVKNNNFCKEELGFDQNEAKDLQSYKNKGKDPQSYKNKGKDLQSYKNKGKDLELYQNEAKDLELYQKTKKTKNENNPKKMYRSGSKSLNFDFKKEINKQGSILRIRTNQDESKYKIEKKVSFRGTKTIYKFNPQKSIRKSKKK